MTRHLPETWYETTNIHNFTLKDFELLCKAKGLEIIKKEVVDIEHQGSVLLRVFPNIFGELAIYHLRPSLVSA